MMKSKSLRKQLTATLILSMMALGMAGNLLVFFYIRHLDLREFDSELREETERLAAMTVVEPNGELECELLQFDLPEYRQSEKAVYFQLWTSSLAPFVKSPSMGASDLPTIRAGLDEWITQDIPLPDGREGRAMWTSAMAVAEHPESMQADYDPHDPKYRVYFCYATSREDLDQILILELLFAGVIIILMILCALMIVRRLISRAIGQVTSLADTMGGINMDTLSSRVPDSGLPLELAPIAAQFNKVLARLEKGVEREKRFNADIAHELRTPITALLSLHELAVEECKDGTLEDPGAYSADALKLTERVHRLIETLSSFHVAGLQSHVITVEAIEPMRLIAEVWKECWPQAKRKSIQWHLTGEEGLCLKTDPILFHTLILNLVDNAVNYAPQGSSVQCSVEHRASKVVVFIENTAQELSENDVEHLTEPFWRKDASRSDSQHSGLGLSLVVAYADLIGAEVSFRLKADQVLRVEVAFPIDIKGS